MPEKRNKYITHSIADPPICEECQKKELSFFDPSCPGCSDILADSETSISEIFAIIRQWVPQVQQNLETFVNEITRRGAGVNDRDGLTDMTLLHYACKSGAVGVGDVDSATTLVTELISQGADVSLRCRWTDMLPVHYAAFFNSASVIRVLLKASGSKDIDATCSGFDNGTILHIAASNLCLDAAKCLLQHGANAFVKDDKNRTPLNTIPEASTFERDSPSAVIANKLRRLLCEAETSGSESGMESATDSSVNILDIMGLKIGDKVVVGDSKVGILRYCGSTDFAEGQWAGVELQENVGKNDGSVGGKTYFNCKPKHGIFCPVSKISKPKIRALQKARPSSAKLHSNRARVVHAKHTTGGSLPGSRSPSPQPRTKREDNNNIKVGDRLILTNDEKRKGIARFVGETQFAPGLWVGVELDTACGKNDGSVNGVRYFDCQPNHGLFSHPSKFLIEKQEHTTLAESRAISASDDSLNTSRLEDPHSSNPDLSDKKYSLSPLTRQLSSSVPDLSKKTDKKSDLRRSGIPRFKRPTLKTNNKNNTTEKTIAKRSAEENKTGGNKT
ncbi:CAP-Gly domain-containing linker protein 3-like [Dendronephthya gigantea]|uniref:CAP-Gly domain-containing linker protein 3-like n=1 Tax=Dendronephthya gigantea TaxID=151771 RepID=UPI00106C5D3E|nr:CAP-Gly domain-containing linker protein 3-like [Dendronephthya gigantea]